MEWEVFGRSVPIFVGMGYLVNVGSASHAHALLSDWPIERRGAAHATALQACRAAMAGELDVETARRLFEAFARAKDILAPDAGKLVTAIPGGSAETPGSR